MEPPRKSRKVSLSSLLGGKLKKEAAVPAPPKMDELEEYLVRASAVHLREHH